VSFAYEGFISCFLAAQVAGSIPATPTPGTPHFLGKAAAREESRRPTPSSSATSSCSTIEGVTKRPPSPLSSHQFHLLGSVLG
jgi:hypothetical protein